MDNFLLVWSVTAYVENRLCGSFDYKGLEHISGFSLAYLRELFSKCTGKPLARYVLERRVAHAAFELVHSEDSLLDIAGHWGFDNADTFTRAFRRITGLTPSVFRRLRPKVGSIKICSGIYGVSTLTDKPIKLNNNHEGDFYMDENTKTPTDGTVLYGVPRVGYGVYGCTPFPICLKAAANYLGEDIDYDYAMVASGAAFRLAWDETEWNGGNVDIMLAYDESVKAFKNGIEALGREFKILTRRNNLTISDIIKFSNTQSTAEKNDFINFIKTQIDLGRPCIGLGFIGPCEACLITGYRDGGNTLLGWNFFQDSPEFATSVKFDESGYFITEKWWENESTVAVMSVGEKVTEPAPVKQIVQNAITALTGRKVGKYAKGLNAYDAWKRAITDEREFPRGIIMPLLAERLMCQGDGMDCLADGRSNAASYFNKLSKKYPEQPLYAALAGKFGESAAGAMKMYETLGGWERGEKQLAAFALPEIRTALAALIDICGKADTEALALLAELEKQL
jgi:AraC-type DNA-binding domain-containing proteins